MPPHLIDDLTSAQYANEQNTVFAAFCLVAILCHGGFQLVPGSVLRFHFVIVVVVVVVGEVSGLQEGAGGAMSEG